MSASVVPELRSLQETFALAGTCFGCGPANPHGLRIRSFRDLSEGAAPDSYVCEWTPSSFHHAFPGGLNGGICGALLDCHSNWAACDTIRRLRDSGATEAPCTVTADFAVKLKRVTPMQPLLVRGRVVETDVGEDRAVAVVEAKILAGADFALVTATCRGTFVAVSEGHPAYHRW